MRIGVVGTGYVGLTTAACLVSLGHDVTCADLIEERVAALAAGRMPFFEDGLEELVREGLEAGRLRFVLGARPAARTAEVLFLCVQSPASTEGSIDLSYLFAATSEVGEVLPAGAVIVVRSTVPIGATQRVEELLGRVDVPVVVSPEFLREATAVRDFLHPDRIVVGAANEQLAKLALAPFDGIEAPRIVMDRASAELVKLAANGFLSTKLAFANSVANLCERLGANAKDVLAGIGADHRIGAEFLHPGPGFGGSCLPRDTRTLARIAAETNSGFHLLEGVLRDHLEQPRRVVDKIREAIGGSLESMAIAVWGLAFKAGTDDLRESPALVVLDELLREGAIVRAYDPVVKGPLPGIECSPSALAACVGAKALVVLTEWPELRDVPLGALRDALAAPVVIDARNLLDEQAAAQAGLRYLGLGR